MTPTDITAVVVAATAVAASGFSTAQLSFRVGKLVGKTETLIEAQIAEHGVMREDIGRVAGQLDRHEEWHRGPSPTLGRRR